VTSRLCYNTVLVLARIKSLKGRNNVVGFFQNLNIVASHYLYCSSNYVFYVGRSYYICWCFFYVSEIFYILLVSCTIAIILS